MTFITKMKLQSGDRSVLDSVVSEIQETAARKGVELKGPHSDPTRHHKVAQYKTISGGDSRRYRPWNYTIYTRKVEIVGYNDAVSHITQKMDYPDCVHIEIEVEQTQPLGHTR